MTSSYKHAGVDVELGDALVDWIQTSGTNLDSGKIDADLKDSLIDGVGGFAAITRLAPFKMKKPCLITCTDGVGTKVKLASYFRDYSTVGQDLVAMCVNDLVTCGGRPLYFLDYYATSKLEIEAAKSFLKSVRHACQESGCLLIGGETAEMPGVYQPHDFDCAGFASGLVEEDEILGRARVTVGDVAVGISSSGFHSNGFSLLRKVFADDLDAWREPLLRPTALYPKLVRRTMKELDPQKIHAFAHITGGGIENIPRVLPANTQLKLARWTFPPEFLEVQKRTHMSDVDMLKTLNCGIGFVAFVDTSLVAGLKKCIEAEGFRSFDLGTVQADPAVQPSSSGAASGPAPAEGFVDLSLWGNQ